MSTTDELIERANELGARVDGHPEHIDEVVPELVTLLSVTDGVDALLALITALGKAWCPSACEALLPYADQPDDSVRLAATQAAPGGAEGDVTDRVADVLIRRCADSAAEVRDWATFGLGTILSVDSAEVREALLGRLDDPSRDVRDEAIVGLARRHDRRVLQVLTDRLSRDEVGSLVFDAASYLADASLMALLEGWDAVLPEDARVRSALDACDPARQQARVDVQGALLQAVQRVLDSTMTGGSAALWSERLSSDVLLGVSSTNLVWSVDSLLKRGEGDALVAAQLVAFDLA